MNYNSIAKRYINMLPNSNQGEELPMPKFILVNQPLMDWNGLCIFQNGENTIKLQKRISQDPQTISRIIAHEVCHAWAFWKAFVLQEIPPEAAEDHGGAWVEAAKIVNQHEGQDFVTEVSDTTYVTVSERMFYVFVEQTKQGLYWSWFAGPSDAVNRVLHYKITHCAMHGGACTIIKTNDERLWNPENKLPHSARLNPMPEDLEHKLHRAVLQNPITDASPRDITALIGRARVANLRHF
jgi:hypothetical protein